MDVILDTNVFRSDILLRSKNFDILLDYLAKTDSVLIVPQIILDEIRGLYLRTLNERIIELNKIIKNVNLTLPDSSSHIKQPAIDIDKELHAYSAFLKDRLKINEKKILPYNNDYLPEIAKRAINRQKPSGEEGQGFRDVLIWLTIKDYCKKCHEKQVSFISNNSGDFANSNNGALHDSLIKECDENKIKINYFKNLKDFIEIHSTKIDFINDKWVEDNLDDDFIIDAALNYLSRNEKRSIFSWFRHQTGYSSESYNTLNVFLLGKESPTVYDMTDNILIVNVTINVEVEVEFIYQKDIYDPDRFDLYYENRYDSNILYLQGSLYFEITLKNNEIIETELTLIDI